MPDSTRTDDPGSGDSDSRPSLWKTLRRLVGGDEGETSLRAQIEEAIDEHEEHPARPDEGIKGDLSPVELTMLRNLLHFSDHDADDIAIPRSQIIAIRDDASWDELVGAFAEHGHSRLPVFRETLDHVVGMVHIKDIFPFLARGSKAPADWTLLMRQPLYVPQARGALDVLADMRAHRTHLAVVVDEYSGTDGIITIEDLVEEIVGNIEDEHDDAPAELVIRVSEGVWDADARAELDDVATIVGDPRLAEIAEAVDTLGGLAFVLAEEVPQPGTMLNHPTGWRIEVTAGDETHVTRLRLHAPVPEELEERD
ncbi:hemolysin family protein [Altericroceibacterium xinjiangense]|uniref:hemolysin family protein n=1 Tax=Altericroceibacterium xinjiangense TaxID=762261 RepID=UPI000F7D6F4E|nr:hemolysin family protein [Altericroceibacterium xinjiangense]